MTYTLFDETGTEETKSKEEAANNTALLLDKFSKVEINNVEKITPKDKEICEQLQEQYDELNAHQTKFLKIFDKMQKEEQGSAFNLKDNGNGNVYIENDYKQPWHKQIMFTPLYAIKSIKEKMITGRKGFIYQIKQHFETTYNLEIDLYRLEEEQGDIHYTDIVEFIIGQLDGISLTDSGIERMKSEFRNKIHRQSRVKVKGKRVLLTDYIWYDYYRDEPRLSYSSSSGAMSKLNLALSYFEQGVTHPLNIIQGYLPHEQGDQEVDTTTEYELFHTEKIKGVRFYKNRRVDLRFKDAETAKAFYDCMELFKLEADV